MHPRGNPETPGRAERLAVWGVLALLLAVAVGVWVRQFHADPFLSATALPPSPGEASGPSPAPTSSLANVAIPPPFIPLSPPESFDSTTLSDKIDGKADLYLSAGFRRLTARRIAMKDASDRWAEIFIYEMKSPESALAVYSQQRRSGARPLAGIPFGYRAANAFYAIAGSWYLEAVASQEDPELTAPLEHLFRSLWKAAPEREVTFRELSFFPERGARLHQAVLYLGGAFGYDGFSKVYAVPYPTQEGAVPIAFVASVAGKTGEEAARGYLRFLEENGARRLQGRDGDEGIIVLDLFGWTEVVFFHGPFVAGVHQAEAREPALDLARALRKKISGR